MSQATVLTLVAWQTEAEASVQRLRRDFFVSTLPTKKQVQRVCGINNKL